MRVIACLVFAAGFIEASSAPAQVFDQAVKALTAGNYAAAEEGFSEVLKTSPNAVAAMQDLGLVYSRTERLDKAIAIYRRALTVNPDHKGVLMNLGLAYIQQEAYGDALPVYRKLVEADPGNLPARELLATSEFYVGDIDSAVRRFQALRREDPKNAELLYLLCAGYVKQNRPQDARNALQSFIGSAAPAQASFALCKVYSAGGRFDEAVDECRKTLQLDSRFPGAHRELGKALVSQHSPEASKELAAAIQQDPNDPESVYLLGVALLQENKFEKSSQYLERAKRMRPGFWGSYFYLGKALLEMGRANEAVPLLQHAAKLNPGAAVLFYELGRALKATGRAEDANLAMQRVRQLREAELQDDAKALHKR